MSKPRKPNNDSAVIIDPNSGYQPGDDNTRAANAEERAIIVRRAEYQQLVISDRQFVQIFSPPPAHAVKEREGPGGTMLPYLPHGYVEDVLNKTFGLDWDFRVLPGAFNGNPFHLTVEEVTIGSGSKARTKVNRSITVMGELTVRVRNPNNPAEILTTVVKVEPGSNPWYNNIEFGDAMKSAASDAFKRCCLRLGIGLALYYDEDASQQRHERQQAEELRLAEIRAANAQRAQPKSLPELITRAKQQWGFSIGEIAQAIGAANAGEVAKAYAAQPGATWEALLAYVDRQAANSNQPAAAPASNTTGNSDDQQG